MDKKVAKLWIKALRSGKYKQTTERLTRYNKDGERVSYCCLGVLCDLYDKQVKENQLTDCDWLNTSLPDEVIDWAKINSCDGEYETIKGRRSLMEDNDKAKRGFKQIADIIEKKVDEL